MSAKYYSRSRTPRNIIRGVALYDIVPPCDWLSPWRAGCRVIGRLGGRHVWGCGQCLWRVATIVEKGVIRGGIVPLDTWCIDGSDWVILTVLMGKEVEDVYPRIVLQVNSRARGNNSNAYA